MLGLLDQMEAENPEDPALAPKASPKSLLAMTVTHGTDTRFGNRALESGPVPMSSMCKSSRSLR